MEEVNYELFFEGVEKEIDNFTERYPAISKIIEEHNLKQMRRLYTTQGYVHPLFSHTTPYRRDWIDYPRNAIYDRKPVVGVDLSQGEDGTAIVTRIDNRINSIEYIPAHINRERRHQLSNAMVERARQAIYDSQVKSWKNKLTPQTTDYNAELLSKFDTIQQALLDADVWGNQFDWSDKETRIDCTFQVKRSLIKIRDASREAKALLKDYANAVK